VILSNPPFSLKYSIDDEGQAEVLGQYELRMDRDNGKIVKALLSSVMFLAHLIQRMAGIRWRM
jgi:hypothetical protein